MVVKALRLTRWFMPPNAIRVLTKHYFPVDASGPVFVRSTSGCSRRIHCTRRRGWYGEGWEGEQYLSPTPVIFTRITPQGLLRVSLCCDELVWGGYKWKHSSRSLVILYSQDVIKGTP
jgi:hypothetical protein